MTNSDTLHWWLRSVSGAALGLTFAFAVAGLFAWYGPGGIQAPVKNQASMWLVSAVWLPVLAASFVSKSGWKVLTVLTALNVLAFGAFAILRGWL